MASLHPASFCFYDYTMADNFYAAMLPFFLAGLISMMFRPARISTSILTGVAFAILWNTRDEGLLLVALLPVWIVLFLWLETPRAGLWSTALRQIWKPVAIFGATAIALILAICALNQKTFGAFAKSDMASSSFQSLIHALLRIKPDQPQRFVSIPTENFRRAFAVSPTFARLKPQLEGETGEAWRVGSFRQVGVKNEIGTGWMLWAIRDAASRSGIFETPAKALRFFRKAAREINRACDENLVPTRSSLGGYLDPLTLTGWKFLPQSFCRVTRVFVRPFGIGPAPDDSILRPDQIQIYDEMTLRQPPASREPAAFHISSWIEAWIGQNHRFFVWALILCAIVSIVIVAVQRRSFRPMDEIAFVVILLGAAIFLRVALFTALDATVFSGDDQRYLIPVMPLFSIMLLLLIYQAMQPTAGRCTASHHPMKTPPVFFTRVLASGVRLLGREGMEDFLLRVCLRAANQLSYYRYRGYDPRQMAPKSTSVSERRKGQTLRCSGVLKPAEGATARRISVATSPFR